MRMHARVDGRKFIMKSKVFFLCDYTLYMVLRDVPDLHNLTTDS